jgi:hypothetical protein
VLDAMSVELLLAEAILDTSLEKGKDQAGKQYKKEKRREIADHVIWRPTAQPVIG